jgi:hypothetical protein
MQKIKKYCVHCCQLFIPRHNPQQDYCSQRVCQNKRKYLWRKRKQMDDPDYRINKQFTNKKWQRKRADYWRNYRAAHPEYVKRNRQQQRLRDKKYAQGHCKSDASPLAKSDTLQAENNIKSGIYRISPVVGAGLAKSDALLVEISFITMG